MDDVDAVFVEFAAVAASAPPGYRPTRTPPAAAQANEEPVWHEFTATAELAPPGVVPTRSRNTVRGKTVLPLDVFAGLHPECRPEIAARLRGFADRPEQLFDVEPNPSVGGPP